LKPGPESIFYSRDSLAHILVGNKPTPPGSPPQWELAQPAEALVGWCYEDYLRATHGTPFSEFFKPHEQGRHGLAVSRAEYDRWRLGEGNRIASPKAGDTQKQTDEISSQAFSSDIVPIPNKPGNGGLRMQAAIKAMVESVESGKVEFRVFLRIKQTALTGYYPQAKRTVLVEARKAATKILAARGFSDKAPT
jgi:hypothetical protein